MRPAISVILLTTLIGAGQGLFLAVYATHVLGRFGVMRDSPSLDFVLGASVIAMAFAAAGLVASFFHLGRPSRAWRSASQWRTSWLSREVIALPAFMACLAAYAAAAIGGWSTAEAFGVAALVACIALFVCTGMVYACIRFLQEWSSPLTLVNFFLLGTASGTTFAAGMAAFVAPALAPIYAMAAVALTTAALVGRMAALARNGRLRPRSTLQTAIGIKHPHIEQKAQGSMGGSFNTREFFHGSTSARLRAVRQGFIVLTFVAPIVVLGVALTTGMTSLYAVAFLLQYAGLLAERWYFLAQANHPQNLYYQAIS